MELHKMNDIKYIIADNVKLCRKKQNLTQFELAEKADLSIDSVKRIEHGSRAISLENFMRIANALSVVGRQIDGDEKSRLFFHTMQN